MCVFVSYSQYYTDSTILNTDTNDKLPCQQENNIATYLLTYSMKQSPFWETNQFSVKFK
jgi:hypothetical protein